MRLRRDLLRSTEAAIIGLFLIQSIRFLFGTLYAHVSSADLVRRIADVSALVHQPGYIRPATVERELLAVGFALLAPLLALLLARTQWSLPLAVAVCVVGRSMALRIPDSAAVAAAVVVGAALLYMVLIIVHRPNQFPVMLLGGFTLDQLIRATDNTFDPTWEATRRFALLGSHVPADRFFLGVTVFTLLLAGYTTLVELEVGRITLEREKQGMLSGWGSLALGSYLFMELALLGLPNAVARWANVDYSNAVPWLLMVTALPLIPAVRDQARIFLGAFDGVWRGWLWTLLLGLLLILGNRFEGPIALLVLILAQFVASLTPWWMVRLRDADSVLPNPTPVLALMSLLVFGALAAGDYFTYDYAFVRDIQEPFAFLGDLFRSFRGMGLLLFLVASLLVCMPIILERRVIPWRGGRTIETYFGGMLVIAVSLGSIQLSAPPALQGPSNLNCLRIGTLNIHSGYTLLFDPNLQRIADALTNRRNPDGSVLDLGIDILLLQEVDAGRLSSFGVDQAEWLGRELAMEVSFFAQNEALQGLAVLSRVPIVSVDGEKLTSQGPQAGVMHVELAIDEQPFHVYNVWLGFQTTDASGQPLPPELQDQTKQNAELEQLIVRNHAPDFSERIVLGGTFNFDRGTLLYDYWNKDTTFIDPFRNLAIERTKTIYLVDNTSARFDYIWLMNLVPSGAVIDLDYVVSDHRLALVQVNRTPDQPCR